MEIFKDFSVFSSFQVFLRLFRLWFSTRKIEFDGKETSINAVDELISLPGERN